MREARSVTQGVESSIAWVVQEVTTCDRIDLDVLAVARLFKRPVRKEDYGCAAACEDGPSCDRHLACVREAARDALQLGGCPARVRPQPVVRAEGHRGVLAYSRALFAGYGIAVETTATRLDGDETSEPASSDLYPVAAAKITAITPANVALRA